MSDNVVSLSARRSKRVEDEPPHMAGMGHCLACQHRWQATALLGTHELVCPVCSLKRGVWVHPPTPPAGEVVWQCTCGSELFMLREHGPWCAGCGTYASWPS